MTDHALRSANRYVPAEHRDLQRKDEAMNAIPRTGGHILIEQLALHGADTVFGVPGESFLAALDGMYQSQRVRFINARHEGGAAMMADAYGKLTGRPGIAFATRGPGATNGTGGPSVPTAPRRSAGPARRDRSSPGNRVAGGPNTTARGLSTSTTSGGRR